MLLALLIGWVACYLFSDFWFVILAAVLVYVTRQGILGLAHPTPASNEMPPPGRA